MADPLPFGPAVAVEVASSFSALAGGTPAVLATRVRFSHQHGYDATVALSSAAIMITASWVAIVVLFPLLAAEHIRPRVRQVWGNLRQVAISPRKLVLLASGSFARQLPVAMTLPCHCGRSATISGFCARTHFPPSGALLYEPQG